MDHAQRLLEEHLPLEVRGRPLVSPLLGVAVNTGAVESVCTDLVGSPDPETIRRCFKEQLRVGDLSDLEQRLGMALAVKSRGASRRK